MTDTLPLSDLRVIAVEQYGAGPFGTQLLGDLGADVIKIEDPRSGGDVSRSVGPHFIDGAEDSVASLFYQAFNRNKRSATLDLARPAGVAVLHDLVKSADAVAGNLRGDVPAKLGLTYDHLGTVKPSIVCAHLTAYGRDGPRAAWPGYDYLMQAEAGYFAVTGEPGTAPARMGLSIVDYMAGVTMGLALLAAVHEARRTGRGRDVDVSLFDTALSNLAYLSTWYLGAGHNEGRQPRSVHPSLTPCQLYKTADGWVYLMCNKEKFWQALCQAINREGWADDERFRTFKERRANRDLLTEMLDAALSTRTTAAWMETFAGRVPAAPLCDVPMRWTIRSSLNGTASSPGSRRAARRSAPLLRRSASETERRRLARHRHWAQTPTRCCPISVTTRGASGSYATTGSSDRTAPRRRD